MSYLAPYQARIGDHVTFPDLTTGIIRGHRLGLLLVAIEGGENRLISDHAPTDALITRPEMVVGVSTAPFICAGCDQVFSAGTRKYVADKVERCKRCAPRGACKVHASVTGRLKRQPRWIGLSYTQEDRVVRKGAPGERCTTCSTNVEQYQVIVINSRTTCPSCEAHVGGAVWEGEVGNIEDRVSNDADELRTPDWNDAILADQEAEDRAASTAQRFNLPTVPRRARVQTWTLPIGVAVDFREEDEFSAWLDRQA